MDEHELASGDYELACGEQRRLRTDRSVLV